MKFYHITITSKNKKSINDFLVFFFNNLKLNYTVIKKYFQKKKKKKILTMLKSPHVNKTAQEQFESRLFSKQLTIYSPKNFQAVIFFKKSKINLFSDVKLRIKFAINKKLTKNSQTYVLNPNNFQINFFTNSINKTTNIQKSETVKTFKTARYLISHNLYLKQTKNFLSLLDAYGELLK